MFAEINKNLDGVLPFVLYTLGEAPRQNPVNRMEGMSTHQILWVRSGEGIVAFDDEVFVVKQGDGFVMPRGVPHRYHGSFHTCWCTFSMADSVLRHFGVDRYLRFSVPDFLDNAKDELERFANGNTTPVMRSAAGYTFVVDLLEAIRQSGESADQKIRTYLESHYGEDISLDDLAVTVGCDRYAVCRLYKKARGITVMDDLKKIRVAKAKRLLQYSADSIEQISHQCGFGSPSYFTKRFREEAHCTPREYRDRYWSDEKKK